MAILPLVALIIKKYLQEGTQQPDVRAWLVFVLTSIWGIRLAVLYIRRHTGEDFRFIDIRKKWSTHGECLFYVKAYFGIFLTQGFFSLIVNSPVFYIMIFSRVNNVTIFDLLGILVWLCGMIIEWVSDEQLRKHMANKDATKPKFYQSGLWKYSRHPNYFGEAVL